MYKETESRRQNVIGNGLIAILGITAAVELSLATYLTVQSHEGPSVSFQNYIDPRVNIDSSKNPDRTLERNGVEKLGGTGLVALSGLGFVAYKRHRWNARQARANEIPAITEV